MRRRDLSIAILLYVTHDRRMTLTPLLSVKEAADLAGVSKKTIERAYKKHFDDPEFQKLIEKRKHGSGYRYFVARSFVEQCVMRPRASSKRNQSKQSDANPVAIVALRHQLEVKDRRIDELLGMLSRKEEFNEALIRRGLNLPEGMAVDEPTEEKTEEDSPTSPVVNAEVVVKPQSHNTQNGRALFPTLSQGIKKVGNALRADVFSKTRS